MEKERPLAALFLWRGEQRFFRVVGKEYAGVKRELGRLYPEESRCTEGGVFFIGAQLTAAALFYCCHFVVT